MTIRDELALVKPDSGRSALGEDRESSRKDRNAGRLELNVVELHFPVSRTMQPQIWGVIKPTATAGG